MNCLSAFTYFFSFNVLKKCINFSCHSVAAEEFTPFLRWDPQIPFRLCFPGYCSLLC